MDLTLRRLLALRKLPKPCLRQRLRRWECGAWECALEGALVTSTASLIGAFMRRGAHVLAESKTWRERLEDKNKA